MNEERLFLEEFRGAIVGEHFLKWTQCTLLFLVLLLLPLYLRLSEINSEIRRKREKEGYLSGHFQTKQYPKIELVHLL